ncbi:MAG TPA: hypothetical protein VGP72_06335 [Planctomycetota bacterium]|jgi:hypothetical protein
MTGEGTPGSDRQAFGESRALLGIAVCLAALAAALVVPVRLARWPVTPYYAVGYLSDEYNYVERLNELPAGAHSGNPYNRFGDPNVISPFLLDTCCRAFISLTGLDIFAFFWIWRFLFPLALLAMLTWLARETLRERSPALRRAAAGAALALLYLLSHVLVDCQAKYHVDGYMPIFFFLNRIPTNIEFLLALLLLTLYVRFLDRPVLAAGVWLALAGALTVYLRPYAALPWGMTIGLGVLFLLVRHKVTVRFCLLLSVLFAVALLPLVALSACNRASPAYREQLQRLFRTPFPYSVHERWWLFLLIAGIVAAAAWLMTARGRIVALSGAATLAALPFICGLIQPAARELLMGDRFGCFHTVLLIGAGMLVVNNRYGIETSALRERRWSIRIASLGLCAALAVGLVSWRFRIGGENGLYHPNFVTRDAHCFDAYRWVAQNTPRDALVLVDEGYNWSTRVSGPGQAQARSASFAFYHHDLFSALAHRQRVFCFNLYVQTLTDAQIAQLSALQGGTFGSRLNPLRYVTLLQNYRPDYVLWHRVPPVFEADGLVPVPRSENGRLLQSCSTVVYKDQYTEVWALDYGRIDNLKVLENKE